MQEGSFFFAQSLPTLVICALLDDIGLKIP